MYKKDNNIDFFKIDAIMTNLRNAVNRNEIRLEDYDEVVWLIKLVLKSNEIFKTTQEVNYLLSNISGLYHNTKSTGRDRIVDWYFREIENFVDYERHEIIKKIAKYTFMLIPSDYAKWKNILINRKGVNNGFESSFKKNH